MFDEEWDNWFRRRFWPFFRFSLTDVDEIMREVEKMMEKEFEEFSKKVPKELMRERQLPDGSIVREWGPFVYGYSVTIGPDGKPMIREFGNVKPKEMLGRRTLDFKTTREPLVDVIDAKNEIKIIAELPGVEKQDIKLQGTEDTLTISVDTPERKYYKKVDLPAKVDPKGAKSTYKNGILEVTFPKKEEKPKGELIKID